jgi:Na+-translocating ferredoxin:NAD+ oxidoreductase RNF subunit RnfB
MEVGSVAIIPVIKASMVFLAAMSAVFGILLAFTARKFFVAVDPLVEKVTEALAHAHCGACGFAGCEQYAEAVIHDPGVPPNLCTPGGKQCNELVSDLTHKVPQAQVPKYARVICQGGLINSTKRFTYIGVKECRSALLAAGGDKACSYGCLGYGTCARICPFGAITMNENRLPVVDSDKCTGCRKCETACPRKVIEVIPIDCRVLVACRSRDKGAATRKNCTTGCIGCGKCIRVCPVSAIALESNLARIDSAKCTACGLCVVSCPTNAMVITGKMPLSPMPTMAEASVEERNK